MQDPLAQTQYPSPTSKFGRGRLIPPRGRSVNSTFNSTLVKSGQAMMNEEGIPEENLQLVPCRWSNTGWKYVQRDPAEHGFFKNPNRVNSFGFRGKKQNNGRGLTISSRVVTKESPFQTSYGRFYNANE